MIRTCPVGPHALGLADAQALGQAPPAPRDVPACCLHHSGATPAPPQGAHPPTPHAHAAPSVLHSQAPARQGRQAAGMANVFQPAVGSRRCRGHSLFPIAAHAELPQPPLARDLLPSSPPARRSPLRNAAGPAASSLAVASSLGAHVGVHPRLDGLDGSEGVEKGLGLGVLPPLQQIRSSRGLLVQ